MRRAALASLVVFALWLATEPGSLAQQSQEPLLPSPTTAIHATSVEALRTWDTYVAESARSGALRLRSVARDPALASRIIERFEQFHQGVRIWGADVVRDSERGVPLSIFGALAPDLSLSVAPAFDAAGAGVRLRGLVVGDPVVLVAPELVVLRLDSGEYRLAYTGVLSHGSGIDRLFIDAQTGAELMRYSEIQRQQPAVGTGTGVLGDRKKLSVQSSAGTYLAFDQHRPPTIETFDMRGNLTRTKSLLTGLLPYTVSDLASDSDNIWSDVAVVDAHVHVSWTYDYYFKRFGRNGLDGRNGPIDIVVNAVSQQGALSVSAADADDFVISAFYCPSCGPGRRGVMFFGSGIPPGVFLSGNGRNYTHFSGALDIAAHELTHAVTSATSNLVYRNESGALNEAFSDMMGKSVEFFYHPPGSGAGQADYVLGKDIARAVRPGALNGDRSMADPGLYDDPDHYSRRYTGTGDNGGVHINSGIANHAFYLAIEGGTNRTSARTVQGVGAANREQIEKVFYRAFTLLLPASATFATAREATIQAARDLYGAGGTVERAVTEAWDAVGVFPQPTLTFSFLPSPAARTSDCGSLTPPCWTFRVTVQETSGLPFNVGTAAIAFFNDDQTFSSSSSLSFSSSFTRCGSGSARIAPRGTACADYRVSRGGRSSGYVAFALDGTDDNGTNLSFVSSLLRLAPASGAFIPTTSNVLPKDEFSGIESETR